MAVLGLSRETEQKGVCVKGFLKGIGSHDYGD